MNQFPSHFFKNVSPVFLSYLKKQGLSLVLFRYSVTRFPRLLKNSIFSKASISLIQLVLLCLASRYCLLTQTCVTYTYTGRRINLDIKTIMKDTGLSRRSCQRAMSVLYGLGLVSSKQKRFTNEFGEVRGLRAKRTLTGKFFKWLGVWNLMENAKKNYKKENTPFAMPKEKKPTKEEIFNSFKKGIDVFSNPSRQTAVFTINEKHIFDSLSFTYSLKLKIPLKEGQALAKKELGYSPY